MSYTNLYDMCFTDNNESNLDTEFADISYDCCCDYSVRVTWAVKAP